MAQFVADVTYLAMQTINIHFKAYIFHHMYAAWDLDQFQGN